MAKSSNPSRKQRHRRVSRETRRELWVGLVTSFFAVVALALIWWIAAAE
jgi:hypothetical protein